jgi:tetratricopeptide (TPR) repeat protein
MITCPEPLDNKQGETPLKKRALILTFAIVLVLLVIQAVPASAALGPDVKEAVVAGDWSKVVELVSPTLKFAGDIPARLLMVNACRASNRNNSAERQLDVEPIPDDRVEWFLWLDTLLKEHPKNPSVLTLWADARYRARRSEEYHEGSVSAALSAVSRAINFDKDNAFAYKIRGDIYLAETRFDHALSDYEKAVELDPELVEARFNLGVAYEKKEQYEKAIEEYTKALEMSPGFAKALTFRGAVYRQLGNIDRAIEDCNAALVADDTYAMAHFVKGMAYSQADMEEMSKKSFEAFIASAPPKLARMARNAQTQIQLLEEQRPVIEGH